jgi:membrane-bound metal-dependent hydrolase YbcI (DUF457 family)
MNFGGHLMAGWLISNTSDFSRSERAAITIMAISPDVDGIFMIGPASWYEWHRTFGHNIFWALIIPLITLYFIKKGRRAKVLPFLYIGMLSHFILDLFVTGWWILMPFWPLSDWAILMSRWIPENIMKYHIQIGLFILFTIAVVYLIIKKKRTPLEIFGKNFDTFIQRFVTLPLKEKCAVCGSRAFYRCDKCGATLCGTHRKFLRGIKISCKDNSHALKE